MRCISRAKSAALVCVVSVSLFTGGCIGGKGATPVTAYELKNYNQDLYQGKLYAEDLCVAQNDVALEGYTEDTELHSAALFDLTGERVLYSYKAHERLYPASTTKIMTALLAIENADLDDAGDDQWKRRCIQLFGGCPGVRTCERRSLDAQGSFGSASFVFWK